MDECPRCGWKDVERIALADLDVPAVWNGMVEDSNGDLRPATGAEIDEYASRPPGLMRCGACGTEWR